MMTMAPTAVPRFTTAVPSTRRLCAALPVLAFSASAARPYRMRLLRWHQRRLGHPEREPRPPRRRGATSCSKRARVSIPPPSTPSGWREQLSALAIRPSPIPRLGGRRSTYPSAPRRRRSGALQGGRVSFQTINSAASAPNIASICETDSARGPTTR